MRSRGMGGRSRTYRTESWPVTSRPATVFDEFMRLGRILQVPERMLPGPIADYWEYFDEMVDNTLVGHRVAHDVLATLPRVPPGTPAVLRPVLAPVSAAVGRVG